MAGGWFDIRRLYELGRSRSRAASLPIGGNGNHEPIPRRQREIAKVLLVLGITLCAAAFDKTPGAQSARTPHNHAATRTTAKSVESSGNNLDPLNNLGAIVGHDLCNERDNLIHSERLKKQFVALLGPDRWSDWKTFSAACGAIEEVSNPKGQKIIPLSLRDRAYAPYMGTMFLRPDGTLAGACFAEDSDKSEWRRGALVKRENAGDCGAFASKDAVAHWESLFAGGAQ